MTQETAAVVGVGPGLGAALVRTFSQAGYTVLAAARSASGANEIAAQGGGGRVIPIECDATVPQQVEELFNTIERQHPPLRVAIFNAGAFKKLDVVDTPAEEFERSWRIGCFDGSARPRAWRTTSPSWIKAMPRT